MRFRENEAKKITESTQTIGIASVLIATVAFTAAFALPGGYRADDHKKGGTPTLAGHYAFDVFIIANTLAFICAGLSITSLMYAGVTSVDIRTRMTARARSFREVCCHCQGGPHLDGPVGRSLASPRQPPHPRARAPSISLLQASRAGLLTTNQAGCLLLLLLLADNRARRRGPRATARLPHLRPPTPHTMDVATN